MTPQLGPNAHARAPPALEETVGTPLAGLRTIPFHRDTVPDDPAHSQLSPPANEEGTAPPPDSLTMTPAAPSLGDQEGVPGRDQRCRGVLSASGREEPTATIPGFEILSELGRGGMGVVYKARQIRLNRLVALKMVLAGGHARPEERHRFLAEAEAIAAAHHPGIVQVYDFGTHDGLPFFSLEFCPGGSLSSKLAGTPLPAREAAQTVEQVARAVQAAHTAGIIHRDLKPGNVLLGEDGAPRVTDFGLARRIESGPGMTQTGSIMGTPSYMSPERARGSKHIGPPADIWSLGAILYECLTGRPLFKAATPLDTVVQGTNDIALEPLHMHPGFRLLLKQRQFDRRYAAVWHTSATHESVRSHGLAPAEQLARCRELAARGYRPVAITVSETTPGQPMATASVWQRPVMSETVRAALAYRQASAAAALVRLGQAERAWPVLRHSAYPDARSWLIHRLAAVGVDCAWSGHGADADCPARTSRATSE
jgi:hypothetical protein